MPHPSDELLQSTLDWAQRAVDQQWLQAQDIREINALETRHPGSLFEPGTHRPLVAAFFGGTGVGKSSLLNRLAGQAVARTGVERPTSREVSIYLHDSVHISRLPNDFPLDKVRIAQHHDAEARQVMWVDMPDIDSVEQHNRELVLEWIPHIDVLIYVVSPERYRDDKGWRLLREYGGDHAWLFVLNQWDRGQDIQLEDFRGLLATTGFSNPVVLRTDCRENAIERKADDFAELQSLLREISAQHVMGQLETRAEQARINGLNQAIDAALNRMGQTTTYRELNDAWEQIWGTAHTDLLAGLEWPMKSTAAVYSGNEANPLSRSLELAPPADTDGKPSQPKAILWDDWAEGRVRDAIGQLIVEAGHRGLPVIPFKNQLDQWPAETGKQVLSRAQLMLRQALAQPGNGLQRASLKVMGLLAVVLPLAALSWASYQVVKGYYDSATDHLGYLGTDFAVHSLLLVGLSWLLPWFAYRQLRPSVERSALKGLRSGVTSGLAAIGEQVSAGFVAADEARELFIAEVRGIQEKASALLAHSPPGSRLPELLQRMLPDASEANASGDHSP
ncbi:MAG: hypothetical protein RLZZ09_3376 [Pseudomonadota bacterium]